MAHRYAGVLGLLAFTTALARGVVHGSSAASALWAAWLSLLAFAAIGMVVGWIAGRTVDESVRRRFALAMQTDDSGKTSNAPAPAKEAEAAATT